MKKILILMIAAIVMFSSISCKKAEDDKIVKVTYLCSIGAYLQTLRTEIDKWNAEDGAEKGVYIELISNIDTYDYELKSSLKAGKHFNFVDLSMSSLPVWTRNGYVKNLWEIENPELKALIEGYEPYLKNMVNIYADSLGSLPLEVVPIKFAVNTDIFTKNGLELPKTWDDVLHAAKIITENGNGEEFGFGWTNWMAAFKRLVCKATMNSTGKGWWDPNTSTYSFSQFKVPVEAIATMYKNGWLIGADDLSIDAVRAQFAAGRIGMFPAPSYDYAVYTHQFPAKCNWTVIDIPAIGPEEAGYKGIYLDRCGCSIDKILYDKADQRTKKAIENAFIFLNSDKLNSTICSKSGIIPYKPEIAENTVFEDWVGVQWPKFCYIRNYAPMSFYPDGHLKLDGKTSEEMFCDVMHGYIDFDTAAADLEKRYNEAYKRLKDEGKVDLTGYSYTYDIRKE